ncbi:HlyD family secretion protein [Xanthomonas medicagonis]|uniref:HlyD family secretion protein n=1 Tax=Xanthomonas medicagonis TaxID=3160841 RepID=UPI003518149D
MSDDLFRKEAVDSQRSGLLGSIFFQAPRLGWVFFGIGAATIVAIFAFLFFGHYTRRQTIEGTLVPSTGLLVQTTPAAGVIGRVLVREGERVHAGQPLIEISLKQESTLLGDTQQRIADQLDVKQSRLHSDLAEQQRISQQQQRDLRVQLEMLRQQVAQKQTQTELQQQRADNSMALYKQWSGVAEDGIISKVQLAQQRDIALQNLSQLNDLKSQVLQLKQQAEQVSAELIQLPSSAARQRNETERQLADVRQSMASNAAQSSALVRASADGIVANVLIHPGQAIKEQQSLLTVLAADTTLRAELWMPSQAIGFVRPGKPVLIRYRAFPYQKFGQYLGRIESVSRSATSPSEISALLGQQIAEPRYRVEVALDHQQVDAYGRKEPLKPGMTLEASVLLDRRRLIEWLFEPLYEFAPGVHGDRIADLGAAR